MKNLSFTVVAGAILFLSQSIHTFTVPLDSHGTKILHSSTELAGLRTFLRRKLSRSSRAKQSSNSQTSSSASTISSISTTSPEYTLVPRHHLATTVAESITDEASESHSEISHMPLPSVEDMTSAISSQAPQLSHTLTDLISENISSTTTSILTRDSAEVTFDQPYTLPSIHDRELTNLEAEFREMLLDFSQYTQRDILAVRDPRMRVIFQGVAASFGLPEVYRAFEILFQDYAPLRVAGRLIYGKLKNVMEEAQLERRKEVESVAELTGLSKEEIEASRSAYFKLVVHEDDSATEMSLQQIVDSGLAEMAVEVLGYENFDEFVESLNPCKKQKVDFERLMIALQSCPIGDPSPECNPSTVLQEIAGRLDSRSTTSASNASSQKKEKLNERYNNMVQKFREWKSLVPNGDGRRLEILRGCFVGAESDEIVVALRVVYTDFSALRMSGDLIFKVMATLVGRQGVKVD